MIKVGARVANEGGVPMTAVSPNTEGLRRVPMLKRDIATRAGASHSPLRPTSSSSCLKASSNRLSRCWRDAFSTSCTTLHAAGLDLRYDRDLSAVRYPSFASSKPYSHVFIQEEAES